MDTTMDHLYKYISESSTISQKISIQEQINIWKSSNNDQDPEILIDLEQIQHFLAQRDQIGILLGGQYQKYNAFFQHFLKSLLTQKVKLRFFLAGHQLTDEPSIFIPRIETDYCKFFQMMDELTVDAIVNRSQGDAKGHILPPTIEYNLIELIKRQCPKDSLHINYNRHSQSIIKYVNENAGKVLAVISNDLNLLLFEGTYQFWYANSVNRRMLNVSAFCRRNLERSLGLNTKQLQLLSVVMGSAYIPPTFIDHFLSKHDVEATNKIEQVASYIKRNSVDSNIDLRQIAHDLFDKHSVHGINAITNGLNCYHTVFSIDVPKHDPFTEFSRNKSPFIYKLIVDDVYLIKDILYFDYRESRTQCFPSLVVPLIQKLIGILFKKQIIKPVDRKICIKIAHDEPSRIIRIPVIYPNVSMPDAFALVYKNREFHYDPARWLLLAWVFDLSDELCAKLKKIPKTYVSVVLTLQYLIQQQAISVFEADAILYSEYQARNSGKQEVQPNLPDSFEIDYIQIAHLNTKMFALTNRCLEVCGLNRQTDLLQFDGAICYGMLTKFNNESEYLHSLPHLIALSQIANLRIYSTEE